MIVRAFNITIATASMPNTVIQVMHSNGESNDSDEVVFSCWEWLSICEKKKTKQKRRCNCCGRLYIEWKKYFWSVVDRWIEEMIPTHAGKFQCTPEIFRVFLTVFEPMTSAMPPDSIIVPFFVFSNVYLYIYVREWIKLLLLMPVQCSNDPSYEATQLWAV